jgi:hypothetical protein
VFAKNCSTPEKASMETTIPARARFTAQHHQILNAWRDILDDIRHLCASLSALPAKCSCGDGQAHLIGLCACCRSAHEGKPPPCEDCDRLLATLTPAVNKLTVDTWQFFPSVPEFLDLRERQTGMVAAGVRAHHVATVARQDAAGAVERHIAAVVRTSERLVAAVDEFRAGCRASHLQRLKMVATDLRTEVERLDRAL